jgi:uncharacterized protein with ACT and thioredoxin-like domain
MENMLTDLELVIKGLLTEFECFIKHTPSNITQYLSTFDFEGFVIYREINGIYDYNKIKTRPYYKSHKYKIENIEYLSSLGPKAREVFPLCYTVYYFF